MKKKVIFKKKSILFILNRVKNCENSLKIENLINYFQSIIPNLVNNN